MSTLRRASLADAELLGPMMIDELRHALSLGARGALPADAAAHARERLLSSEHLIWVVESGEGIDGFIHLHLPILAAAAPKSRFWHKTRAPAKGRAFIRGLFVEKRARRSGVAGDLARAAHDAARAAGYEQVFCHVLANNKASLALCGSFGYQPNSVLLAVDL